MKNSELTYTLIGIVVLAIIAWLVFGNTRPDTQEEINPIQEEILETETEVDSSGDSASEEYVVPAPGTKSPVNQEGTAIAMTSTRTGVTSNTFSTQQMFPGIFTLGVYYIENINKKGIDACKGRTEPDPKSVDEDIEYSDENFKLEQIMYKNGQVFLSINAQEIPEDMCAYIIQKELGNSPFSAVHLIVK